MNPFKVVCRAYARWIREAALTSHVEHLRHQNTRRRNATIAVSWYRESDGGAGEFLTRSPREAARVAMRRQFTGCDVEITIP